MLLLGRMGRLTLQRHPQNSGLREADSRSSSRPGGLQGLCPTTRSQQLGELPPVQLQARGSERVFQGGHRQAAHG